jgi:hypothetical protein
MPNGVPVSRHIGCQRGEYHYHRRQEPVRGRRPAATSSGSRRFLVSGFFSDFWAWYSQQFSTSSRIAAILCVVSRISAIVAFFPWVSGNLQC